MLTNEELICIRGGGISATLVNAVSRLVGTLLNLGQLVGTSIRRSISKKYCKLS